MTEHTLETLTGPDTLDEIQHTLDEAWAGGGVSDSTRMSLELAASEIGANIIEHSAGGQPVHLRMAVSLRPGSVTVTFTDDGRPAAIDLARLGMPDGLDERGRGLAIAHRVLDELSYRRDDVGNRWTLVKRCSQ